MSEFEKGSEATASEASEASGEALTSPNNSSSKNVAEILAMDSNDESLKKYKQSLLGAAYEGDLGDVNDPRRVIVEEFCVIFSKEESPSQLDLVYKLSTEEGLNKLKSEGVTMIEGSKFKFKIKFRVQHELVCGLKWVNMVSGKLLPLGSDKDELVIGSYAPSSTIVDFEFPKFGYSEAPKGMMLRGKYKCVNSFVDTDKVNHLEYGYELNIVKA